MVWVLGGVIRKWKWSSLTMYTYIYTRRCIYVYIHICVDMYKYGAMHLYRYMYTQPYTCMVFTHMCGKWTPAFCPYTARLSVQRAWNAPKYSWRRTTTADGKNPASPYLQICTCIYVYMYICICTILPEFLWFWCIRSVTGRAGCLSSTVGSGALFEEAFGGI